MEIDQEINELEKWVFQSDNKDTFIKQLINDTESHYYFTFLKLIDTLNVALSPEQESLLKKFNRFKSLKSKGTQIRYLLKLYDLSDDQETKTQILKKLNKKLLKINFKHTAPKHLGLRNQRNNNQNINDNNSNISLDSNYNENQVQIRQRSYSSGSHSDEDLFNIPPQQMQQMNIPPQMQQMQMSPQMQQMQMPLQQMQQNIVPLPNLNQQQSIRRALQSDSDLSDNEAQQQEQKILTYLDDKKIDINQWVKKAYNSSQDLGQLSSDAYLKLDVKKFCESAKNFDTAYFELFFKKYNLPTLSNEDLKLLIDTYTQKRKNNNKRYEFDQFQIVNSLTLQQIEFLNENYKEFIKNQQFTTCYYQKLFGDQEQEKYDEYSQQYQEEKRKKMIAQYQWALQLPIKFKSLSDQILYEILNYGIQTNHYDFDLLLAYIKNPKEKLQFSNSKFVKVQETQFKKYSQDNYWYNIHRLPTKKWVSQEQFVETYILQYYQTNKSKTIAPFDEYFSESYLHRLLIKAQLYNGENNIEGVSDYFTPGEIRELNSIKTLTICVFNKKVFKANEEVKLYLEMRNIPKLQVKIFEFQAENYYLKTNAAFDNNLDLDGLQASEEMDFDFASLEEHPCKKIIREFKFDNISKKDKGIFIIEFFGNGIASRVVINKGQLNLIQRQTVAGHQIRILDETGKIQSSQNGNKAGIWLDKQFYEADDKGEILIPFKKEGGQQNKQIIIVSENYAVLSNMTVYPEQYSFDCFFFYNQEQFLMGQKATILVQPRLTLNSEIAPLDILEDSEITIVTTTEDNIPSTTKFDKIKFSNSEDYAASFQVPAKLLSVNIKVKSGIKKSSRDNTDKNNGESISSEIQRVERSQVIKFTSHKGQNVFTGMYLKKNTKSQYQIHVLGKNGESKPDMEVDIIYQHRYIENQQTIHLQTDKNGTVSLGKLKDIVGIIANLKGNQTIESQSKKWVINDYGQCGPISNLPSQMRIREGEDLRVPFANFEISPENFVFLRFSDDKSQILENVFSKLEKSENGVIAKNLKKGTYTLRLIEVSQSIQIQVMSPNSKLWNNLNIMDGNNLYDRKEGTHNVLEPIYLQNVNHDLEVEGEQKKNTVTLNFKVNKNQAKNLKVHVIASQQYENHYNKPGQFVSGFYEIKENGKISLAPPKSTFMSNRQIGDELAYVFDRKQATRFTGNSLEKPQILLKRQFVKDTTVISENLRGQQGYNQDLYEGAMDSSYSSDDEDYRSVPKAPQAKMKMAKKMPARSLGQKGAMGGGVGTGTTQKQYDTVQSKVSSHIQPYSIDNFINFLQNPSFAQYNLQPNDEGQITIELPAEQIGIYCNLQIIASTSYHISTYNMDLKVNQDKFQCRDLTQKTNLQKGKFYSIFRNSSEIFKNGSFKINDITSTEYSIIDTLPKLFDLVLEIAKFNHNQGAFSEDWGFLKNWMKLTYNEKLSKYNEFQSDDLNFFLYQKDKEFFEEVVKKLIQNKLEKDLIDWFLLDSYDTALDLYDNVERFSELNSLEHCLIIYMLVSKGQEDDAKNYLSYFDNTQKCKKTDVDGDKKLFDIALNQIDKVDKTIKTTAGRAMIQQAPQRIQMQQQLHSNMCIQQSIQPQQLYMQSNQVPHGISNYRNNSDYSASLNDSCEEEEEFENDLMEENQCYEQNFNDNISLQRRTSAFMVNNNELNQFDVFDKSYQKKKYKQLSSYNPIGQTKEYKERHYYNNNTHIPISQFWLDFARYIIDKKSMQGFVSKSFLRSTNSVTELVFILSCNNLSFTVPEHQQKVTEKQLEIVAQDNVLVFTKEIKEGTSKFRPEIMINQRFFDPKDRYTYDEDEPGVQYDKDVDQFIINKIYGCQVIITNSCIAQQQLTVLHEVPQGSIPVNIIEYTKSSSQVLQPYSSKVLEYFFYFPEVGTFSLYPANVSKDGTVFAVAKDQELVVQKEQVISKLETINQILSKGSQEDILKFIETKNILNNKIFNFNDIYHLLGDKQFFLKLVKILKNKRIFDYTVFSYGLYHGDHETARDFLNHETNRSKINKYVHHIQSSLIKTPKNFNTGVNQLKLLEYYPIQNSRVHLLQSGQANISNQDFRKQYLQFLKYMTEKDGKHDLTDKICLVYYLLIQERVNEALKVFKTISPSGEGEGSLQYDYIAAYLDFYEGYPNFTKAREIIEKYLDYPVISWRNLFYEMANQLGEYDGEELEEDSLLDEFKTDKQKNKKENETNAEKEPILDVKMEGSEIVIENKNLKDSKLTIQFYTINLEVFFSKKPFLSSVYEDFSYLKPTQEIVIDANVSNSDGINITKSQVPQNLQNVNVFVQVNSKLKKSGAIYFSTSLKAQVFENYGQLKITNKDDKPLSKVYVKTFSKVSDGVIKFYKDGYTDLRGKFDYLSLNSGSVGNIKKLAIFIQSDDLGSLIKEVSVPSQFGKVSDTVVLRTHNWKTKLSKQQKPMSKCKK